MLKIKKIAMTVGITTAVISVMLFGNILPSNTTISKAAKTEEAELRIVFTTDIHGQLNSMDYEQGVDYSTGGLARAYDLIKQARKEKPDNNTLTFDVGDVLYDYTTEYIYANYQKEIQPIYKAVSMIGYDAITLGNHEFDYGYDYLLDQLNGAGLMDKVVVSNVMDSKTGEYPFLENMLITKELTTVDGKKAKVTIGVIGETIPILSTKTDNYIGVLKTEDIVANVKTQAAKLKNEGADIVVVLSHSGMGPENPELNFKNVSYALTKIDEVDVVLCGHEHNMFPTTDLTSSYYKLPGVDKKTNLINGKNLVMASDRGKSIGVVDLMLNVSDDEVEIIDRVSSVRQVSENKTTESASISSLLDTYKEELLKYSKDVIATVDAGESINNYFGLLQDNDAIQLLNDAKRSYAIRYVNTEGEKYKDYPILAVSTYDSYGVDSYLDYVKIENQVTESDLVTLQDYNKYLAVYTITGKQLKEWLEWSASAYEVTTGTINWTLGTMSEVLSMTSLKSLIKQEWLADWSNFYIFDGIDYTINPMILPRYDLAGTRISDSNRVSAVLYNGKAVADDMVFILASDKITQPSQANVGIDGQAVYKKFYRSQAVLSSYIKELNKVGSILPTPDYNWRLDLNANYQFIVRGPSTADTIAKQSNWLVKLITSEGNYNYYSAVYPAATTDKQAPKLLVVPTSTTAIGTGYNVAVNATDISGISSIKYLAGDHDLSYSGWNSASEIKNNVFFVNENGIYSIYAEDKLGNKVVKKVSIDNIGGDVIGVPKVETYTNRKTKIQGTAEKGTIVVFKASTGTYETEVSTVGTFSYALPSQPSGSTVTVYAKDEETSRVSESLTIKVKRTGPNRPTLDYAFNNSDYLSGSTNDDDGNVIAIVGDNVYVSSKGGKEAYEKAVDIYDSTLNIIETNIVIQKDETYKIDITPPKIGTEIKVYNIDHLYRVSRVIQTTVKDGGPNLPEVYVVTNIEHSISGNVTSSNKKTVFNVYAVVNGTIYDGESDTTGDFTISIPEQLKAKQVIKVYATDTLNSVTRTSAIRSVVVSNIDQFTDSSYPIISLEDITNSDLSINGTYNTPNDTIYLAIANVDESEDINEFYEVVCDEFGDFTYQLSKPLKSGTKIYALSRFIDGDIIDAAASEVEKAIPSMPSLLDKITNNAKQAFVVAEQECKVDVQIGTKKYTSSKYYYNEELESYIYTVDIGRADSGTVVKIYATNSVGKSSAMSSKITKTAPDSPKVDEVYTDSTTITGTIELFDVIESETDNPKSTIIEKTNTKIYALIGTKTYEGDIDEDGNYTFDIKKQKKGTVIKVWGTNEGGRGPLTSLKVQVKKK